MSAKNKSVDPVGVGRPLKKVVWPSGRFILEEAVTANPKVCKMTVINHLAKALEGENSVLVKMEGEDGKAKSGKTLGRKPFVYLRRAQRDAGQRMKESRASKSVTVPVADITPETSTPTPASTPVADETAVVTSETVTA